MNRLRWIRFGFVVQGGAKADEVEGQSSLREALFPVGIFASWWLLYFY